MNEGVIASRYAKALLKYVAGTGSGDKVYSQACVLGLRLLEVRQLRYFIENNADLSMERKIELLRSAAGEDLVPELVDFIRMVTDRRRMEYFSRMLYYFIALYRKEMNIKVGRMVTAAPVDGLKERLELLFHQRTGAEVHIEEKISPEILGGFVFEMDGYRLDASVENQFRRIRRQLIEKNNRIV